MHSPITLFQEWLAAASAHAHIIEPTAMTLATVSADCKPSARIVLLKGVSDDGFVFYTNSHGRKGRELAHNPNVALIFYWMPMLRQVRVEGSITLVSSAEADAYFASRGREKQIGAWASHQSEPLDSRETLLARIDSLTSQYEGQDIPRPPHWNGYRVCPNSIEFWEEDTFRIHNRYVFARDEHGTWQKRYLNP